MGTNFYGLPKVHRSVVDSPPPYCGRGSLTGKMSTLISCYLLWWLSPPILGTICTSNDLFVSDNIILVTLVIEALYSSLPYKKCLEVIEKTHNSRPITLFKYRRFIVSLLKFLLGNNTFKCDDKCYAQ